MLKNISKQPIGIFDSGIGGLTVLKEIGAILPSEDIIYFGDTARVPYGNKSKTTIVNFSQKNTKFLLQKKAKIIVVACNTSSALSLDHLKKYTNIPVIGVINAGIRKSLEMTLNNRIGIIGTRSTIDSKAYETIISKISPKVKVYSKSCPLFVPLVEEGLLSGEITKKIVKLYLTELRSKKIDTLILGCTHYPLLKKEISSFLKNIQIVDSAKEVAFSVRKILIKNNLLNSSKKKNKISFYVSDDPNKFTKLADFFLNKKISASKTAVW